MNPEMPDTPLIPRFDLGHDRALDKLLSDSRQPNFQSHTEISLQGKKEAIVITDKGGKPVHLTSQLTHKDNINLLKGHGDADIDLRDAGGKALQFAHISAKAPLWQPGLLPFGNGSLKIDISRQLKDGGGNLMRTFEGDCSIKTKPLAGKCHLDIKEKGNLVASEDIVFSHDGLVATLFDRNKKPLGLIFNQASYQKNKIAVDSGFISYK